MDVYERTVEELFKLDLQYVVPLYQRPYVWNEKKQWEPLWSDIEVVLNHRLHSEGTGSDHSHFLGAVVLDQERTVPGQIPHYTVIDGQQRLTTLQLVLAAARQVAEEAGEIDEAGMLAERTINDKRKTSGDDRLKVWPTNANRAAYETVVLRDARHTAEDDPKNLIQEAYGYFVAVMRRWLNGAEPHERQLWVRALRVTLTELVKVVSITLGPSDNAQVIFETLNARGTPLLALDLVKNAAFHEARSQGCEVDVLHEEVWRPELGRKEWRHERRQGRLLRAHGELFLMHWLVARLGPPVPATELFWTFRKQVLQVSPHPDMDHLIRQLNHDARVYRSFDSQPPGSAESLFFERLNTLDVTTFMPLALLLFTEESTVSRERRLRALKAVESWLIRRMIVRLTTKNYNEEVGQLLRKLREDLGHADEVVIAHLAASKADTSRWPIDEEVRAALVTRDLYGAIPQARLTMVLRAIEQDRYDDKDDVRDIPRSLWIEHVMPQKWEPTWPIVDAGSPEDLALRTSERNRHVHKIGNLTLTSAALDIDLSNRPWAEKQVKLAPKSRLKLTTELLLEPYKERFDEAAIDERSATMAEIFCRVWPRPVTVD